MVFGTLVTVNVRAGLCFVVGRVILRFLEISPFGRVPSRLRGMVFGTLVTVNVRAGLCFVDGRVILRSLDVFPCSRVIVTSHLIAIVVGCI